MKTAVVITAYNQPGPLWLTLVGYALQTRDEFEVIVADDGSEPPTRRVIERARSELGLRISHIWQPDRGFRKCRILNRAITETDADYLIFTDGDCVPRNDFVATHLKYRQPGHYLSGGYVKLNAGTTAAIDQTAVETGDFCRRSWLVSQGYPRLKNLNKLLARGVLANVLNAISRTRAGWHGHNASCWKRDAEMIQGFDERMGWGGEDREFGYRLINSGIQPIRIRYHAICIHLHHDRPWSDRDVLAKNDALRAHTLQQGVRKTEFGITRPQ